MAWIADVKDPTLFQAGGSLTSEETHDVVTDGKEETMPSVELARSTGSQRSDGELDRSFKFGGLPKNGSLLKDETEPLTLSNIIPPPDCVHAISEGSLELDDLEDDSVLKSIYAKLAGNVDPCPLVGCDRESSDIS